MADTKITALTAITGDSIASTDDFVVVDISDTTMSASGTNKKITALNVADAMSFLGITLVPAGSILIAANRSQYVTSRYEIANGQSLEIISGGFFEIG